MEAEPLDGVVLHHPAQTLPRASNQNQAFKTAELLNNIIMNVSPFGRQLLSEEDFQNETVHHPAKSKTVYLLTTVQFAQIGFYSLAISTLKAFPPEKGIVFLLVVKDKGPAGITVLLCVHCGLPLPLLPQHQVLKHADSLAEAARCRHAHPSQLAILFRSVLLLLLAGRHYPAAIHLAIIVV